MTETPTMKIVCDENIAHAREFFASLGELICLPGRHLSAADIADADALIVRSVTNVTRELLAGSKVKFVGSATIGFDHIDLDYLRQANIAFAGAPGCNARAVVEYVLTALIALRAERLSELTVAVVGAGNVGGRLLWALDQLGVNSLMVDPFVSREQLAARFVFNQLPQQVDLARALQAEVICLHTPLTKTGVAPTYHLIGEQQIAALGAGSLLLNAGRGAVIDNQALLTRLQQHSDLDVVLDVWEGEPAISQALLDKVKIGSPHIAGYSAEGKLKGTQMVYQALCEYFALPVAQPAIAPWQPAVAYDIYADDRDLRGVFPLEGAAGFDRLRKQYRHRPEAALRFAGRLLDY